MQPIVVQGTPVSQQQAFGVSTAPVNVEYGANGGGDRESRKETKCNDPIFALLFYIALFAIVAVAAIYAPAALSNTGDSQNADADTNNTAANSDTLEYESFVIVTVLTVAMSFVMAGVGMGILMCIPQFIIKVALIFTVVVSLLMVLVAFGSGQIIMGVLAVVMFLFSCCYAYCVWSRIPFATANLVTACTAIKSNLGITFFAYIFAILGGIWSVIWTLAFVGVYDQTLNCPDAADGAQPGTQKCQPNYFLVFVLFLAFFFVQQVLQNSIHVQVAGTVANWWYIPNENGCCSKAVCNSFLRTVTTSFGSVCFGSFVVAVIQALKQLAHTARQNDDCAALACVAECILGCIADLVEYFNKWAFVYVGIYGMPYIKAGKSVFELFKNRGWEAIIADDLVGNALGLISLVVGLVMGGIAVAIEKVVDAGSVGGVDVSLLAFFLGLVVGLLVTSILMSTIGSGVNAVIVLFAEGPRDFEQNHPALSRKMREVWSEVYPGSV